MKSLLQLHVSALENLAHICSVDIARDVQNVTKRWEDEGDSYLTITLPKLAKALERGLDTGLWPLHDVSPIWKHVRGLPAFMQGFLKRIFFKDGSLLDDPDTDCIWAVRQFCYLTQKLERDCTPERVEAALAAFVSTDADLAGLQNRITPARFLTFVKTSDKLYGDMFDEIEAKVASFSLVPGHGPGSVAEKWSQKDRRLNSYWTDRLYDVFPYWRYTSNLPREIGPMGVPMDEETPVRVISVPKTQSTPRIIAIEPAVMQYAQQGLKREFYELIGRGPLSKVLGFQFQDRNRELARSASLTGSHATLDLSEASDRVHWMLIYAMLHKWPHLRDLVFASRSSRASVRGHGVIPLNKFASMGSALTFPLEAMVFTTLAVCGIEQTDGRSARPRDLPGRLSVYGDDIIVPINTTGNVIDWLEHFGAKVNRHKSFWTGKFRESCGAEYYNGTDVSVVRFRHELPRSRSDAAEIAALVDFRNRAYRAGLWSLCSHVDKGLEPFVRLPIASARFEKTVGEGDFGYLHQYTFLPHTEQNVRYNRELQRWERRVPRLKAITKRFRIDDEQGLLEWFHGTLRREDLPEPVIPGRVKPDDSQERATSYSIQRRWLDVTE